MNTYSFEQIYEILSVNYNINLTKLDNSFNIVESTNSANLNQTNLIKSMRHFEAIEELASNSNEYPVMIEGYLDLIWIVAFHFDKKELDSVYILGPMFNGKYDEYTLSKKMTDRDYSVKIQSFIVSNINEIPVIPNNEFLHLICTFNYLVNGKKIKSTDILHDPLAKNDLDTVKTLETDYTHAGVWKTEKELLDAVSLGNLNYKDAINNSSSISYGVKSDISNVLRQTKNNLITLLTLISRAAIQGGLSPSISYSLNDYYMGKIERVKNITDANYLSNEMLDDFVNRVHNIRANGGYTAQIQNTCDFIEIYPDADLSIKTLAEIAGYTEYYFSHKFKEETNISINQYILNARIKAAKKDLENSNLSIQDISDKYHFNNRSYFYSRFQKEVGMSPSEYRKKNKK